MKKIKKSQHNIYLSDEGKGENKYVIKGNNLTCRWIGGAILVWSNKNTHDILNEILETIRKEFR